MEQKPGDIIYTYFLASFMSKFCLSWNWETPLNKVINTQKLENTSVRQKGESQNGCFKKTKHVKFSEKHSCVSGGKKYSFFGKFDMICFLETPV